MSSSHSSFIFSVKKEDMKLHRPSMGLVKVILIQKSHMKLIFSMREYNIGFMNFRTKELILSVISIILQFINSAPTVTVEFVISAYQIFQAQNLLGLPSKENPLELDEDVIRQYFSEAQIRVHTFCININTYVSTISLIKAMGPSDGKNKIDVRELHEAYQVVTVYLRSK